MNKWIKITLYKKKTLAERKINLNRLINVNFIKYPIARKKTYFFSTCSVNIFIKNNFHAFSNNQMIIYLIVSSVIIIKTSFGEKKTPNFFIN